jgi:hypothetical protein
VLAHVSASRQFDPAQPHISPSKLRCVTTSAALTSLAYAEDPADNLFAEEFTFYGGSYLVLPGIAEAAEFILSNLCKGIFLAAEQNLPDDFRARAFRLIRASLMVLDNAARTAGLHRGMVGDSNRYENIYIPQATKLQRLKAAATFDGERLSSILAPKNLSVKDLQPLVSAAGTVDLNGYTLGSGPLLWTPFVRCGDELILVVPGMVTSAIRHAVLMWAVAEGIGDQLAECFHRAVWSSTMEALSWTRNEEMARPTPPLAIPCATDGYFALDTDKALYCLVVTDPLVRFSADEPFDVWTPADLSDTIANRLSEIERDAFHATAGANELFCVVLLQGLGGSGSFGFNETPCKSTVLLSTAAEFRLLSLLEGGDPFGVFNFARAQDRANERFRIQSTSVLDTYSIYRQKKQSFYVSDDAPPNLVIVPPGESHTLKVELAHERDFHAAKSPEGGTVEVTSLHNDASIPIYVPVRHREQPLLLVEGLPMPIWITTRHNHLQEMRSYYAQFVGAIAYWTWQMSASLSRLLHLLLTQRPLIVRLLIEPEQPWKGAALAAPESPTVETQADAENMIIDLVLRPGLVPLMQTADNRGERELMLRLLEGLASYLTAAGATAPTNERIQQIIDEAAPLGLKKMVMLLDIGKNPRLDPRDLPRYSAVRPCLMDQVLDEVGEFLRIEKNFQVGAIPEQNWNQVLNEVAAYCFRRLEALVASLSPHRLLEFVIAHAESVCRESAYTRLTLATQLHCFGGTDVATRTGKKITELAHSALASRFLVEYVAACPPRGLRPISFDTYDELRVLAHHLINYAMISDSVRFGLERHQVSVLRSGRLGMDGTSWRNALESHSRTHALDQISIAADHFKRHWHVSKPNAPPNELMVKMDIATKVEFGQSLSNLLHLLGIAIQQGVTSGDAVTTMPLSEFIDLAAEELACEKREAVRWIDFLSLSARDGFWNPPQGYVQTDLYPWRYGRKVSYYRRPFVQREQDGQVEILWGHRHLADAQWYLIDQCFSGRLRPKSDVMKSLASELRHSQGEDFNNAVADWFSQQNALIVKRRVKRIGADRELQNHLGDIDVLVGDPKRRRVLVVECKDLSLARTPFEMSHELTELFDGVNGKKSIIEKHEARTQWVKAHLRDVVRFLGDDSNSRWAVVPLIAVDEQLVAPHLRQSPISVFSLEELKRKWPRLK